MFIGISVSLVGRLLGSTAVSDPYEVAGFSPSLVFDFAEEYYRTGGSTTTFDAAMTHARSGNATMVDASGAIQTVSTDEPRVGHHIWNGSSWINAGYLHESEVRVQLLHTTNALVTQSHTVTAVPHTLHFTGTGTVTLSGASTAGPLVGTGTGENNRVSLTFTPTAASLTLTVSGTVTNAQLEVGSTPSSYIPNLSASGTVTRAADTITVPYANLPWPTPNVIGEELVTNGTFDADLTGWGVDASNATASYDSGAVTITRTGTYGLLFGQELALTPGAVYKASFDVISFGGGGDYVILSSSTAVGGGSTSLSSAITTTGTKEVVFVATAQSAIGFALGPSDSVTIDNISVREIDPLSVSIQLAGRMTYADDGSSINLVNWASGSPRIQALVVTSGALTGRPDFIQSDGFFADVVSSVGSYYSPGINVPYNIASRHGSTFINGAVDGTALTANTTPTALPALSAANLQLGFDYMGTIKTLRMWANDLGDTGIAEASA